MRSENKSSVTTRYRPGMLAVFAGVAGFLALVQFFCLFAGIAGLNFDRSLAAGVLIVSLLLSCLFATRFFDPVETGPERPRPEGSGIRFLAIILRLLGLAVIGWAIWVWFQLLNLAWLRPPYDWDGLYYHIPAIHEWVMNGGVSFIGFMPYVPYVNYPMGVELFSFFVYFLLDTSRLVNGCNLWYWPLAILSVGVIAGRLGVRGMWRWVAGALIAGAPAFVCQSASCYIDPGFTAAAMASIAAACVFLFYKNTRGIWRALLLGAALGLAVGSKGTGLPVAVVLLTAVTAGILWIYRLDQWKRWSIRVGLVLLVILAVGGYWYVRNAAVTGNPIYPIQLKFGEKVIIEGSDYNAFNDANLPPWLERYPEWQRVFVSWLQLDSPVSGYAPVGGMGYIWLAGGIPAFILMWIQFIRRRPRDGGNEFVFLSALVLLLFVVQPAAWWARFTLWMHALGLPCLAAAAYQAATKWRGNRWHVVTVVLAIVVVGVAVWESNVTLYLEQNDGKMARSAGATEEYLSSLEYILPGISEVPEIKKFLGAEKIARGPWRTEYGTLFGGVLAMPLDQRTIKVLSPGLSDSDIDGLSRNGIEWIVWDEVESGMVPEVIKNRMFEEHVFNPGPDLDFHFIRLELFQGLASHKGGAATRCENSDNSLTGNGLSR